MEANDIYLGSLALYDEISKTGSPDPDKTKDYEVRSPKIIDMLQKELYKVSGFTKKHEVSLSPIENMLGDQFDIKVFDGNDLIIETTSTGVKAYCFEADGDGTAYIEDFVDDWNILSTIELEQLESGFKAYKGVIIPNSGATKTRIRFTGTYFYRTVNRALFSIPFTYAKIPQYSPWIKIELPSAAKEIIDVISEYPDKQYSKDSFFKTEKSENTMQIYIDYAFEGKVRIQYRPIPVNITSLDQELEIDDITSQAISYGLARWFALSEQNTDVAKACNDKFMELKALATVRTPATVEVITDVYFGG